MAYRRLRSSTLVLALACLAGSAFALNTGFLRTSPASRFNSQDLAALTATFSKALDSGADGTTVEWSNDNTRSSGAITPQQRFERDGRQCRDANISTRFRNMSAEGTYTFCRDGKGNWRLLP